MASQLVALNNFQSAAQVISALNHSSISRLKTSVWQRLSSSLSREFSDLSEMLSPKNNYALYRARVAKCVDAQRPLIPYLAVFLRDATYIYDGNLDKTEEGKWNITKILLFAELSRSLRSYQKLRFSFPISELAFFYFTHLPSPGHTDQEDEEMYALSLHHEAPRKSITDIGVESPIISHKFKGVGGTGSVSVIDVTQLAQIQKLKMSSGSVGRPTHHKRGTVLPKNDSHLSCEITDSPRESSDLSSDKSDLSNSNHLLKSNQSVPVVPSIDSDTLGFSKSQSPIVHVSRSPPSSPTKKDRYILTEKGRDRTDSLDSLRDRVSDLSFDRMLEERRGKKHKKRRKVDEEEGSPLAQKSEKERTSLHPPDPCDPGMGDV